MAAEHPTPVIHERTEPLRELVRQLDAAPVFVKAAYARELGARTVTLLAELCHELEDLKRRVSAVEITRASTDYIQKLEARVAALERFPEAR